MWIKEDNQLAYKSGFGACSTEHLINTRLPNQEATGGAHMARIVSLLGSDPEMSQFSSDFFDDSTAAHSTP